MNSLFIRADATSRIGAGHVMRCMALAQAWREEGGQVVFLGHCESEAIIRRIINEGFDFIPVENPFPHPDDFRITLEALSSPKSWLVLDGYHFNAEYQRLIKQAGFRLLFFDDYGHAGHYYADFVLNQNVSVDESLYSNREPSSRLLLGPRYALLRREFLPWRGWKRNIPGLARKILVTMGGGDRDDVTTKVVEAIKLLNNPALDVKVLAGPVNLHGDAIKIAMRHAPCAMRCIENATNMPEMMAWADIGISGGGGACRELAFMGLPGVVFVLAKNQQQVAACLDKAGVVLNWGEGKSMEAPRFGRQLNNIIEDREARRSMSERGQDLVDGNGARRILLKMCNPDLILRKVQTEDCRMIWEWANDPIARSFSFSETPIPWTRHMAWFEDKLADDGCLFYIILDLTGAMVGQIRYEIEAEQAVVSVSIAPDHRSQGYGGQAIRLGSEEIFSNTSLESIHAYIKPGNERSLHAFAASSFSCDGAVEYGDARALHCYLKREMWG